MKHWIFAALGLGAFQTAAIAQDASIEQRLKALEAENEELRGAVDALGDSVEGFDLGSVFGELGDSFSGLGIGASKVYNGTGVSVGGYGETLYTDRAGGGDQFDNLRAIIYLGYKFNENWVFNSEIEVEHGSTSETGSVSTEFAYIDYLHSDAFNLRGGLVLIPMGHINELHEPTAFLPAARPETERRIIPSTWRENGVGVFGDAGPVTYRAYLVNGLDASGFSDKGLRGGRQKGSRALAEDLAIVGRVDWTDIPGLLIGASAYFGDSGQDQGLGDAGTSIFDLHAEWRWRGLTLRGLYAQATVDDVDELNAGLGLAGADSVGEELMGHYLEAGFDVLSLCEEEQTMQLTPYLRYEALDTQSDVPSGFASDPNLDLEILTFGINFKPIDQIVFKLDYQDYQDTNEQDRWNFVIGYTF